MRIHFIDNLKGILIVLVVIGHVFLPSAEGGSAPNSTVMIYNSIYLFHMPLFIFISGFLAKRIYTEDKGLKVDKIFSFILLALLFHICIVALDSGIEYIPEKTLNMHLGSADWYLASLVTWYLLTPVLSKMRPVPAIAIAFAIGLACGYVTEIGKMFSLSRTLVFLPFFVLGYYCSRQTLARISTSKALVACGAAAVIFLVAYCSTNGAIISAQFPLVFGSKPYPSFEFEWVIYRFIIYAIAILLSLGVMCFTPKGEVKLLSFIGKNTLQVYVLHRLLRSVLEMVGLYQLSLFQDPVIGPITLIFVSLVIVAVCLIPVLRKPFDAVLGIKWKSLLVEQK